MKETKFKQTEIGMIPEDWAIKKLNEVCIKITDGSHFSPKTAIKGKLIATVKDMEDYNFNFDTCRIISEEDFRKLAQQDCKPLKDDVLIAKDGSYLKHVFVFDGKKELVILSSIAILRPDKNKINPYFLKYLFTDQETKERVSGNYVSGAVIPRIVLNDFKKINLPMPSLPEQSSIAFILSSLDAKIELNKKMNKTLEAIGQAIFKRWFVDFEFPDEKGKPYKSSGGKMVESELGMIPEEGKVDAAINLFKLEYGWHLPEWERQIGKIPVFGSGGLSGFHNAHFVEGPGIIIGRAGKIGTESIYYSYVNFCPLETTFYVSTSNKKLINYLYFFIKTMNMTNTGSSVPNLSRSSIHNVKVIVPSESVINKFDEVSEPLFELLYKNEEESKNLVQICDLILPKLMSGEIRVK